MSHWSVPIFPATSVEGSLGPGNTLIVPTQVGSLLKVFNSGQAVRFSKLFTSPRTRLTPIEQCPNHNFKAECERDNNAEVPESCLVLRSLSSE
jgi:hypothetical protein